MQDIRSSNLSAVTGICDPNKCRARHHRSLKLGSKLTYFNFKIGVAIISRSEVESAKLRALRAKNVLICQRVLLAHVLTCFTCSRAHVPMCLECLRASRVKMPCVHMYSRVKVACELTCSRANSVSFI